MNCQPSIIKSFASFELIISTYVFSSADNYGSSTPLKSSSIALNLEISYKFDKVLLKKKSRIGYDSCFPLFSPIKSLVWSKTANRINAGSMLVSPLQVL